MRYLLPVIALMLNACSTMGGDNNAGGILIETASNRQPMPGASCMASNNNGSWSFVTPATVNVGNASGDLRVVCNKPGYRTSEYVFRPAGAASGSSIGVGVGGGSRVGFGIGFNVPLGGSGGGSYPRQVALEMTPL